VALFLVGIRRSASLHVLEEVVMATLSRSWQLVKTAWQVLRADTELLVFPLISGIGALLIALAFAVPTFMLSAAGGDEILFYVLLFLYYLVLYAVTIFSNTALIGAAMIRLRGGNPTLRDGFGVAFSRLGPIAGYALLAATVGVILQALSNQGTLGRIIRSLIGVAWNLVTFLVVPVLVVEDVGPVEAVKRSGALLRRTWGEQIAGGVGMGLVFFLFFLLAALLTGAGIWLGVAVNSTVLIVVFALAGVIALIALSLIGSALKGIYAAAVYRYAADGEAGDQFPAELIRNAFHPVTKA
jgi:hypothetical protein